MLAALEAIAPALSALHESLHAAPREHPGSDLVESRLHALETTLERHMAQAEALVLRAEGQFKAARSSEERERRYAESRGPAVGSPEISEEDAAQIAAEYAQAGLFSGDEAGSHTGEVPAVPTRMGGRRAGRTSALHHKFS